MAKSDLLEIPGIGVTFVRDFARINVFSQSDLVDANPEQLFELLCEANRREDHKTSKNYLYVIRMAIYYVHGGRKKEKLRWSAWKD